MSISESAFQKQVMHVLKNSGAMLFNVHGHKMQASGWPDLQVYHPVWSGHLELKIGKNRLTGLQAERIRMLNKLRTHAFVLRLHPFDDRKLRLEDNMGAILATSDPDSFMWRIDGSVFLRWLRLNSH